MKFLPFVSKRVLESDATFDDTGIRLKIAIRRTSPVYVFVSGAIGVLCVELLKAIFHHWYLLLVVDVHLYVMVVIFLLAVLVIVFLVMKARMEKDLRVFLSQSSE